MNLFAVDSLTNHFSNFRYLLIKKNRFFQQESASPVKRTEGLAAGIGNTSRLKSRTIMADFALDSCFACESGETVPIFNRH